MDTLQVSYFLKVAETEHMTNAAKELHISQPALSRSLRLLEEELGVKLFDRIGRRLILNDHGRQFYASAAQFERGIHALQSVKRTNTALTGALTVQIRVDNHAVIQAVADFSRKHPGVLVTVVAASNVNPSELQWDFRLDAFNPLFSQSTGGCIPLFDEPYLLAVSETHPPLESSVISLSEAKDIPFVLPTEEQELTQIILAYCQEAGFRPVCRMETNNYLVMLSMVSQGDCVALVPQMASAVTSYPHIRLLHLREQAFRRTIFLQKSENLEENPAAEAFERFILQSLRQPF